MPTPSDDEELEKYYQEEVKRENEFAKRIDKLARTCPTCKKECGDYDFEPADPSVGIMNPVWINSCEEHGLFCTFDDETQKFEEDL